jgi:prevent-host-death family protein
MAVAREREPEHHWQVQEAKQRFSEVLRRAQDKGPQVITRHGEDVAIIIDMSEYRHSREENMNFTEYLRSAPFPEDFDRYLERPAELNQDRDVSFLFEE